jgi:copper chaperone CopZ
VTQPVEHTAPLATVEFAVEGMHCGSCSALIEETLAEQPGVSAASVDLESAKAVVSFTPTDLSVEQLQSAIAEVGYSATPVA